MSTPATKLGKGRHGKRPADLRHPQATRQAAEAMFVAGVRPWRVAKDMGLKFPTVYDWHCRWKRGYTREEMGRRLDEARRAALASDSDPGDAQEDGC